MKNNMQCNVVSQWEGQIINRREKVHLEMRKYVTWQLSLA